MSPKLVEEQELLAVLALIGKWGIHDLHCLEQLIEIVKEIRLKETYLK